MNISSDLGNAFVRSYLQTAAPGAGFAPGGSSLELSQSIEFGRMLRDEWIHRFAILPGALNSFVEVSSSREWMIIGKPRLVSRAVERLNNAFFIDPFGIEHRGWETVFSRMCMDWLTIGRAAIYSKSAISSSAASLRGPIEYLDTSQLMPNTIEGQATQWRYRDPNTRLYRYLDQSDVFFNDCVRLGNTGLFLGKVAWLLPVARLDWYIREHISAKVDGRKIRDIFFVNDDQMVMAVEKALNSALALAMGENAETYGLPVVAVNQIGGTTAKVADSFAKLGLSELPETVNLQEFEMRYVNEISDVLGLSMRYFWTPSSGGTNRSTEQINQERQAVQGPSYWTRSVERMINNSTLLGGSRSKVRFKIEEEVDSVAVERKAKTLKTYAEGFAAIMNLVSPPLVPEAAPTIMKNPDGTTTETPAPKMVPPQRANGEMLTPKAILDFFERENLLSPDITLPDLVTQEEDGLNSLDGDALDRGEVRMNREGRILERRNFQVPVVKK